MADSASMDRGKGVRLRPRLVEVAGAIAAAVLAGYLLWHGARPL